MKKYALITRDIKNKMKKILLAFIIALSPILASATMFPSDAVSQHFEFTANTGTGGLVLIATSTRTILSISPAFKVGAGTDLFLYCGSISEGNEIFETHGNYLYENDIQYICTHEIRAVVTGFETQGAHMIITSVPRNISTTQDPIQTPVSGTFWQATQPVSGTFWQATQPVSGTFWQATQPVSGVFASSTVNIATSTISVDTSNLANFQETLFIACVIIFFLAILAWPTFFRMFRRQDPI